MKAVLLDGKYKVGSIKETPNYVLTIVLEDVLIKDTNQRLEMMHAGRHYWFCQAFGWLTQPHTLRAFSFLRRVFAYRATQLHRAVITKSLIGI